MVAFEDDPAVKLWAGRLGTAKRVYFSGLKFIFEEVIQKDSRFLGWSPSQVVEGQREALRDERFVLPDIVFDFINGRSDWRYSYKVSQWSYVLSFFRTLRALWPDDGNYRFRSEVPAAEGRLDLESCKRILYSCKKSWLPVYLFMVQGFMGEDEVVYTNLHHSPQIIQDLTQNRGICKLVLPGRKRLRNVKNYYTLWSTKSDLGDALRAHLKALSTIPRDHLFLNEYSLPITKDDIRGYWFRRGVETGVVKPESPKCKCGGETVRKRAKYDDRLWRMCYICKQCGGKQWACEGLQQGTNIRYGFSPHNIRDLMRSRWREAGCKSAVAEFLMGHGKSRVDPNQYDRIELTPHDALNEYRKFLPWANILSTDPNKVERSTVDTELDEARSQISKLSQDLEKMQTQIDGFEKQAVRRQYGKLAPEEIEKILRTQKRIIAELEKHGLVVDA